MPKRWVVLMLASVPLLGGAAAFGQPPRTAVLVSETLRGKPYGDLLSIELSRRGVSLVERVELDRIAAEQERSVFGGKAAAARIRIGRLLGARHLALLDRPAAHGGQAEGLRLQVIDVATGLRLGSEVVAIDTPQAAEEVGKSLAEAAIDLRERFPDGVESVVAVTPWLSENLTREYDALQTALAHLLAAALQRQKGVAVVEIDEARRIERERNLGGADAASRPAPWVVEGRFELQPVKPDEPRRMNLSATLRRVESDGQPRVWRRDGVPIEQVASVVADDAASAARNVLSVQMRDRPTDAGGTFEALIERADRFSTIGMWGEAASLREAAIVAAPRHDQVIEQRLATVRDYTRLLNDGLMRGLPAPTNDRELEAWTAAVRQRLTLWRQAMWHVEYMIINRRIDKVSAYPIVRQLLKIPWRYRTIRDGSARALIAADEDRRRFLLEVLPRALGLPAPPGSERHTSSGIRFAALALDSAVEPYYGRLTATDLNLFATLLISKLPAELPPDGQFVRYRLGGPLHRLPDEHYGGYDGVDVEPPVTAEQWEATMRRLAAQPKDQRPAAWAVGEYALLAMEGWQVDRDDQIRRQALYERARKLEAEWRTLPKRGARSDDGLVAAIEELRKQLKPRSASPSIKRPTPAPKIKRPEAIIGEGLEPINLHIVDGDGSRTDAWSDWFDVLPVEGKPQGLLNIWVGGNAVFYERRLGELESKLELRRNHRVAAACWDGRYAWIANPYEGVYLLDAAGELVARFDKEAGLPAGSWTILVQPLTKGRAIAAGTNRGDQRSWIAQLWLDEQRRPRVKVIHAAIKQSGWESWDEQRADPEATCRYAWLWLWDRGEAGRYLIVGRENAYSPVVVDLANHMVTTIGQPPLSRGVVNPFWGWDQRWYSFHAVTEADGGPTNLLLWAGTYGVALYEVGNQPVGPNLTFKRIGQWSSRDSLDMGNVKDGRLIAQPDGSMIFAGSGGGGWGRIRVRREGPEPRLIGETLSPGRLDGFFRSSTAPATGHGIVIWGLSHHDKHEGRVLRVKLPKGGQ